jgi:hypothetical protein
MTQLLLQAEARQVQQALLAQQDLVQPEQRVPLEQQAQQAQRVPLEQQAQQEQQVPLERQAQQGLREQQVPLEQQVREAAVVVDTSYPLNL